MKLNHNLHLAYCTNIHRGENWAQTFETLEKYTLAVREQVCPREPYAIGLRLSEQASRELSEPATLNPFRHWLDKSNCYVFTINGFPYGKFHGTRVKEQVYAPDWTTNERVEYTNRLFDLLAQIVPEGVEGSVSTVPASFKEFIHSEAQVQTMRDNVFRSIDHIARVSERTGRKLHLGLEPEPCCFLETTDETIAFIQQIREEHPNDSRLIEFLGVNYDACHLAVEFEDPHQSIKKLQDAGIRISKLHLSSALKVRSPLNQQSELEKFLDATYLHQVVARGSDGKLTRYKDLDVALDASKTAEEWRIHFHVPLHSPATAVFDSTADHLLGVFDILQQQPSLCSHLEMETYTWEVMPPELKNRSVIDQLVSEYQWCLRELNARGLGRSR